LRQEEAKRIPPLLELPKLLSAAEHVMEEKDTERICFSCLRCSSLAAHGPRPPSEKGRSSGIAKFPRKDDEINTVVWEAVALALAQKAGISVPTARVETVANKPVLLLRRFDRDGKGRIPFLSAMSMLGAKDNETHSYLEIVDALRQHGAAPKADMEALGGGLFSVSLFPIPTTTFAITVFYMKAATAGDCLRPMTSTPCRPT